VDVGEQVVGARHLFRPKLTYVALMRCYYAICWWDEEWVEECSWKL